LLESAIDGAPVQPVGPERLVSFDPLKGGTQSLAISDGGAVAARIEEMLDGLGHPFQLFPRQGIPAGPPTRVPCFHIGRAPPQSSGGASLCPPVQTGKWRLEFNGNTFSSRTSCCQPS
jgi:hypothetical protein